MKLMDQLITKQLNDRFLEVGTQLHVPDPMVITKFIRRGMNTAWYVIAYYSHQRLCYGYVIGLVPDCIETNGWRYFLLAKLEAFQPSLLDGPVTRDTSFTECRFSELKLEQRWSH